MLGPEVTALVPCLTAGRTVFLGRGGNRAAVLKLALSLLLSSEFCDGPLPGRGRGLGQTGIWSQRRPVPSGFSWKNWAPWTRTSRS